MSDRRYRYPIGIALLGLLGGVVVADDGFARPVLAPILAAALGVAASYEALRMAGDLVPVVVRRAALACAVLTLVLAPVLHPLDSAPEAPFTLLACAVLGTTAVVALALVVSRSREGVRRGDGLAASYAVFSVLFVAAPFHVLQEALYRLPAPLGVRWAVTIVLVAKLNDIGGYVVGSSVPARLRHALSPGVSPNKTWEGAVGGVVLSLVGAAALHALLPPLSELLSLPGFLVCAASVAACAQVGDLLESVLKRSFGVKDSGRLLPAFGGALDLVDSLLLAVPAGVLWSLGWSA